MTKKNQDIKEVFAERLKYFRKQKALNQGQLAKIIGVKANTVSNYERAHSFPDPSTLDKIIKSLEISRDDLFTAEQQPGGTPEVTKTSTENQLLDLIESIEFDWTGDPAKISRLKTEIMKLYKKVSDAENKVIKLHEELRNRLKF